MNTSDLTGKALAYAVGVAEGCKVEYWHSKSVAILFPGAPRAVPWNPHLDWSQGGPIVDRERIGLRFDRSGRSSHSWTADTLTRMVGGPTPLVAAMRAFVASKLGDEIEIPEELL